MTIATTAAKARRMTTQPDGASAAAGVAARPAAKRGVAAKGAAAPPAAPATPPESRAGRTRERFIGEAARIFYRHGYASSSVDDICGSAGVKLTKGAFYYNFQSKEHLLFLIQERYLQHGIKVLNEIRSVRMAPEDKIARLFENSLYVLTNMREYVVVANREYRFLTGSYARDARRLRKQYRHLVEGLIADGQAAGSFSADIDPKVAALNYFGMLNWMYQWFEPEGRYSAAAIMNLCRRQFISGIR